MHKDMRINHSTPDCTTNTQRSEFNSSIKCVSATWFEFQKLTKKKQNKTKTKLMTLFGLTLQVGVREISVDFSSPTITRVTMNSVMKQRRHNQNDKKYYY